MPRSKRTSRALAVANTFGTLGYLSLVIQWAWTGLILAYPIIMKANHGDLWWLSPNCRTHESTPAQPIDFGFATPAVSFLAVVIAIVIVVVSVVAVIRLPKNVGKTGAKLTQTAADAIIPVVAHAKDVPKAKRKRLSFKIIVVCTPDRASYVPCYLGSWHVLLCLHDGILADSIHRGAGRTRAAA